MPGSEDGKYEEQVDEAPTEEPKKSRKGRKAAKEESLVDEEKPAARDDDGLQQTGGGGIDDDVINASSYSKTLHVVMLIMLSTSLICLLAIVPSRSLGTAQEFSAGAWEVCYSDVCFTELPCGSGNQVASGVFGIIAIIHSFIMFCLQCFAFKKGDDFAAFPKIQCLLAHLFWLWVLISWACWAAVRDEYHDDCPEKVPDHFYYAWGFVFLVGMWLSWFFLAIILTLKAMGKKVCGL